MKKACLPFLFNLMFYVAFSQGETRISSIDFVQVLNENHEEAFYYYHHNWRWLRERAVEKGYIQDYEFYRVERTDQTPYDMILVTVYSDQAQSDAREANFAELIKLKGDLRLLNEKQPAEFRKLLAGHEKAYHMERE